MNIARAICIVKADAKRMYIVSTNGSLLDLIYHPSRCLLSIRRINFFNDLFQDSRHDLTIPDALALTIRYRK